MTTPSKRRRKRLRGLDEASEAKRRQSRGFPAPATSDPAAARGCGRHRAVELSAYARFSPLVSIFAAGNRAMVKMSENSRASCRHARDLRRKYFPPTKLAFFADGGGRGPAFSSLPFDHLIFTGSGGNGRAVMANAARNLTPVTLELGGKSPAVVAPDFPIRTAAERIFWAKTLNAGQVCLAVDHVFLPRGAGDRVRRRCRRLFTKRYPDINGRFHRMIDQRYLCRLAPRSKTRGRKARR